ncbi:MAG: DUF4399 domain-containing protein [Nitrospina sp.]|jgi:hypothetical protein|nr:DUF4399 domain-containing protein [Nitrospina sp.]MBT6718611.1 DUF4399 domain-containing protein [Nitrospina sp.]
MKTISKVLTLMVAFAFVGCAGQSGGGSTTAVSSSSKALSITTPATLSNVSSPLQVCMATNGYTVEPAKNGVNAGKGHHHLLVDVSIPADLSKPIAKDGNHIHMGDGSKCKTIELAKGQHTITALFAQGNHVPYNPVVSDGVTVTVTHVK